MKKTTEQLKDRLAKIHDEAETICLELLRREETDPAEPACGVTFLPRELWPCGYWGDGQSRDLSRSWPLKDIEKRERRELADPERIRVDEKYYQGIPGLDELLRGQTVVEARDVERLQFREDDMSKKPKSARHAAGLRFASSEIGLERFRQRKIDIYDEKAFLSYLDGMYGGWEDAEILKENLDQGPRVVDG